MPDTKIIREGGYQPTSDPGEIPEDLIRRPRLSEALAHELRVGILRVLLERGDETPMAVSRQLGHGLSQVSLHFKLLMSYGVIELTKTTQYRGAVEHHYRIRESILEDLLEALPPTSS